MKLEHLYRGFPGHPLHPPLTDATIGTYTFATIAAVLSKVGIAEQEAAQGWTIALIVGLILSGPTAITGFVDWLRIERSTPLWRTATAHMIAMLIATGFALVAALLNAVFGLCLGCEMYLLIRRIWPGRQAVADPDLAENVAGH